MNLGSFKQTNLNKACYRKRKCGEINDASVKGDQFNVFFK